MPTYRIKDWNRHFENAESRKLKTLKWVGMPNRMDSQGYTALVDHPNGAAHFGAWCALVEICSAREPKEMRGTLPESDGTIRGICRALGRISRLPSAVFEELLPRLLNDQDMQWIEQVTGEPGKSPEVPGEHAGIPGRKGREGEGREGEKPNAPDGADIDGVRPAPATPKTRTLEDVRKALGIRLPWFEHLCAVHPAGKDGVKAAAEAFARKVTADDAGHALALEMWRGAKAYAERCAADPSIRVKWVQGWITDERWRDANAVPTPTQAKRRGDYKPDMPPPMPMHTAEEERKALEDIAKNDPDPSARDFARRKLATA